MDVWYDLLVRELTAFDQPKEMRQQHDEEPRPDEVEDTTRTPAPTR